MIQQSGGRFDRGFNETLDPGEHGCCNWKNKDCNKHGKRDSILTFNVLNWYVDNIYYCQGVAVKAGGWMDINGSGTNITCTAYY